MAQIKMEVHEGGTRSYVDGELVREAFEPISTRGHLHFGRYTPYSGNGNPNQRLSYHIKSMKVKKWDVPDDLKGQAGSAFDPFAQ